MSNPEAERLTLKQLQAAMKALPPRLYDLQRTPDSNGFIFVDRLLTTLQHDDRLTHDQAVAAVKEHGRLGRIEIKERKRDGYYERTWLVRATRKLGEWVEAGCPTEIESRKATEQVDPGPAVVETFLRPTSSTASNSISTTPGAQRSRPAKSRGAVQRKPEMERPRPPWAGNDLLGPFSHRKFAERLGITSKQLYERLKLLDDPTTINDPHAVWRQNTGTDDRFMFCVRDPREQRRLLSECARDRTAIR